MKDYIILYLKGIAMGSADVIPGVSGGTIALITGIYERLLLAIKQINFKNIKLLFSGNIKQFWKNIDANFLICLFLGIATSFLLFAHLITYLMEEHPILIWSFFFGLIIASAVFVCREIKWNVKTIIFFILFTIIAFFLTSPENAPAHTDSSYWYISVCGAIAICAMILPGISGSFILLLLGQYFFLMQAIKDFNFTIILLFGIGAIIGLISFANVLSFLFKNYRMLTLSALSGFMIGSLNKLWPWKETTSTYTDSEGIIKPLTETNILPTTFETITNNDSLLFPALAIMFLGFAIVFVLEYIGKKIKPASSTK